MCATDKAFLPVFKRSVISSFKVKAYDMQGGCKVSGAPFPPCMLQLVTGREQGMSRACL
jgi:hypothetical protein